MNTELTYTDATKLAELIRNREVSPVEEVKAHLDRIEALNPKINAIVTLAGNALESARAAEAAVLRGDELGPLHGVPFTVKDSIDTAEVLTQRGSPIFKGRTGHRCDQRCPPQEGWRHPAGQDQPSRIFLLDRE